MSVNFFLQHCIHIIISTCISKCAILLNKSKDKLHNAIERNLMMPIPLWSKLSIRLLDMGFLWLITFYINHCTFHVVSNSIIELAIKHFRDTSRVIVTREFVTINTANYILKPNEVSEHDLI